MRRLQADFSARGWNRVLLLTICGSLFCIGISFFVDGYSFRYHKWQLGSDPLNDLVIPLLLAPPFFFYLLCKQRELAIAHHELLKVASTDGLTSCLNRQAFTILVEAYLERTARLGTRSEGALMVIDVDHFKAVNDRFGHMSGDEALRMISGEIKECLREHDLVGRIGGEEFGVFLPGGNRSAGRSGGRTHSRIGQRRDVLAAGRPRPSFRECRGDGVWRPLVIQGDVQDCGRVPLCREEQWPQSRGIL
jgi:GGDEF domain-containing protein